MTWLDVEVRYVDERGDAVAAGLAEVDAEAVVAGRPVRRFPTYRSQSNYPGWLWSVTMGRLVGYESLLERDRLWLADFDPTVRGIASQPFSDGDLGPLGGRGPGLYLGGG